MADFTYNYNAGTYDVQRQRFADTRDFDVLCDKREYAIQLGTSTFVAAARAVLDRLGVRARMSSANPDNVSLAADEALVQVWVGGVGFYDDERARHNFPVYALGRPEFVAAFFEEMRSRFGDSHIATANWWYASKDGNQCRTVPLQPPQPSHDAFYPFVPGGVAAYTRRYLTSDASLLFLMGPPGTGKTSLVRRMVYDNNLAATFTYDEALLGSDEVFVDFITDNKSGVLIVEDADTLVGSRESEGNKLISRFLNVSDGLIKTSGKKIVFTTNLGDFRRVDPALVRSGRCFDALRFRSLSYEEAAAACAAAGLPPLAEERDYALSEIFHREVPPVELAQPGY